MKMKLNALRQAALYNEALLVKAAPSFLSRGFATSLPLSHTGYSNNASSSLGFLPSMHAHTNNSPMKRNLCFSAPSICKSRCFSTESAKVTKILQAEMSHEASNYEAPGIIKKFLEGGEWKFEDNTGDVNMTLVKQLKDGKKLTVDFQLVSPFQPEEENEERDEMTDFSVTVEAKDGSGLTLYCTTLQNDEKYRFMTGNIRYFNDASSKNMVSAYTGPEFEDLDDSLQEALDQWLASIGVNNELCDFIDAASIDKEQKEYMAWMKGVSRFLDP